MSLATATSAAVFLLSTASASAAAPTADIFGNTSACTELADNRGTKSKWGQSTETLKFLGATETMA